MIPDRVERSPIAAGQADSGLGRSFGGNPGFACRALQAGMAEQPLDDTNVGVDPLQAVHAMAGCLRFSTDCRARVISLTDRKTTIRYQT